MTVRELQRSYREARLDIERLTTERDQALRQLADAEFLLHAWAESHRYKRSSLGDRTTRYFASREA